VCRRLNQGVKLPKHTTGAYGGGKSISCRLGSARTTKSDKELADVNEEFFGVLLIVRNKEDCGRNL